MLPRDDPQIEQLISKMTLEEKAGQLTILADTIRPCNPDINPEVNHRQADEMVDQIRREAQRIAIEETRLGIPLIFGSDVIHGMWTVFPIPLGEAASFEPSIAEQTARATALETTASGIHWTFAPMVDVARDQRWGRVAEGSGEDVFLGKAFAVARVKGFQGSDLRSEDALLSTPKHFAAYGGVSGGMEYNFASVQVSNTGERDGEEVVQLYIHDCVASRVRPVRELKGFRKVLLRAGETQKISFELRRLDLSFHGADGNFQAEPGEFHLWISSSSAAGEPVKFQLMPASVA
eukprot:g27188.t1